MIHQQESHSSTSLLDPRIFYYNEYHTTFNQKAELLQLGGVEVHNFLKVEPYQRLKLKSKYMHRLFKKKKKHQSRQIPK